MKPLRFIHVSKTGGQTIAFSAKKQASIKWGMFDEGYGSGILCHKLLSHVKSKELKTDADKNKYDWFMVVRNPYDRVVSEYNWSKVDFDINIYLKRYLSDIELGYIDGGQHHTPQHIYLEKQYTIHVLRFEKLDEEFSALMKQYDLTIELKRKINVSEKHASLSDLTIETIEMINRVYAADFTTFGYDMVHDVFPLKTVDVTSPLPSVPEETAPELAQSSSEPQTDP
jgi:hypothetical protein